MHARAVHRAEQLEAEVEQLRGENRKLKNQLFGRKSEKPSSSDRSNHLEDEQGAIPAASACKAAARHHSGVMPATVGIRRIDADRPGLAEHIQLRFRS